MDELITVIIPIFNTEKYLSKCIESVLCQSYKNLEIILIDDGSTDGSPQICDEYARSDKRIKVIHKQNEGQGKGRNAAIDLCKGEYVCFLDSDDYLDEDFIQYLYNLSKDYNAEISVCSYRDEHENGKLIKSRYPEKGEITIYNTQDALGQMLYWKNFGVSPWAKLYKKYLWEDVRFPTNIIYEDLATTYQVVAKANKLVYSFERKMAYIHRNGSDIHQPFNLRKISIIRSSQDIIEFIDQNYPTLHNAAVAREFSSAFTIFIQIGKKNEYKEIKNQMKEIIKRDRGIVIKDMDARRKIRLAALVSYFGFGICETVYSFAKKINSNF